MSALTATRDARRWVDRLERQLAPLDRNILLADWRLATGGSDAGSATWQRRRYRLLSSAGTLERIRTARALLPAGSPARRAELLERSTLEARIEQDEAVVRPRSLLTRRIAAFRPVWHRRRAGRHVVQEALRKSGDRAERKRAHFAEEMLYRPMEKELLQLVALRNARARELGFRSFPDYRLRFEGFSVPRFRAMLEEAGRGVPDEMRRWRTEFEDATGERGWYPWDVTYAEQLRAHLPDDAFPGRTMLPRVLKAVRRWGVPSSLLGFRVVHHDIPSGGMSLAPDPPRDVRVVVHPGGGWERYMVLFHEVGHAVSSGAVRQPSHLLRWHEYVPGFAAVSEGEGGFFEQIASCKAWLREQPGLPREALDACVEEARRGALRWIGAHILWISRELALYEPGGGDPEEVSRRLARRLFGFDAHRPLSFADSFSVELPFYSPSYFFAMLLRPALNRAALDAVGGEIWPNVRIGPWLVRHWFREGTSYDWTDRLRELTGRPLSVRPFLEETRRGAA